MDAQILIWTCTIPEPSLMDLSCYRDTAPSFLLFLFHLPITIKQKVSHPNTAISRPEAPKSLPSYCLCPQVPHPHHTEICLVGGLIPCPPWQKSKVPPFLQKEKIHIPSRQDGMFSSCLSDQTLVFKTFSNVALSLLGIAMK